MDPLFVFLVYIVYSINFSSSCQIYQNIYFLSLSLSLSLYIYSQRWLYISNYVIFFLRRKNWIIENSEKTLISKLWNFLYLRLFK